jgi:hypothetical protein
MRSTDLQSVLASASFGVTAEQRGRDGQFSLQNGFHLYTKLKLKALLTDPENLEKASRYLRVVEVFSKASERACQLAGCVLLEVQGHVHHFFVPCVTPDYGKLFRLAASLNVLAYEVIQPIAGDGWNGFAVTAEFGDSIILATTSGSVISLGPCANNPAKKLHQGTPSSTLTYRVTDAGIWSASVLPQTAQDFGAASIGSDNGYEALAGETRRILNETTALDVTFLRSDANLAADLWVRPVRVQGHFARADLNGFTALVKEAFSSTNKSAAIAALVTEINSVIKEAERAMDAYPGRRMVQLPWAGDCANFVVFSAAGENFRVTQEKAPVKIGAYWVGSTKLASQNYGWTIGVAGGGPEDKATMAQGIVLLARITVGQRSFAIAAGWGVGKSIRAQEADGARKGDTVVHEADHALLSSINQKLFSDTQTTQYLRAHLTEEILQTAAVGALTYSSTKESGVPAPKPWTNPAYPTFAPPV